MLATWAKALALFGVIYIIYTQTIKPAEEVEEDLEAGDASNEIFEEGGEEKGGFLKGWVRALSQSTRMR